MRCLPDAIPLAEAIMAEVGEALYDPDEEGENYAGSAGENVKERQASYFTAVIAQKLVDLGAAKLEENALKRFEAEEQDAV